MASSGAKPAAGRSRVSKRDMDCDAAAGFFQGGGGYDLGPQTGVTPEVSIFVVEIFESRIVCEIYFVPRLQQTIFLSPCDRC